MQPLVSIITVCYNAHKHLEECMNSVLAQNYPNVEYLLVDGNSKDGTLQIIQRLAAQHPKISYISEPDKGIYDAMNKGMRMAKGDIIACVNADDYLAHTNVITDAVNLMHTSAADVVHANIVQQIEIGALRFQKKQTSNFADIKRNMQLVQGTSFWTKNAVQQIGWFNLAYKIVADYDYVLRGVALNLKFVMSHDVWLMFRIGGISTTTCRSSNENRQLALAHHTGMYWNYTKRYYTCILKSFVKKHITKTQLTPHYLIAKGWQQLT